MNVCVFIRVHPYLCVTIPLHLLSVLSVSEEEVHFCSSASTDSCVFGVPLIHNVQSSGQPLPDVILRAMDYIRENGMNMEGVFRKTGNAARILLLEETIDRNPGKI